jgi:hypothetical protein
MTMNMLKFYVDFNLCDDVDIVVIRTDIRLNRLIPIDQINLGARVILYDESMECEAVLIEGKYEKWGGKLQIQTIRQIPPEEWSRLNET